uniref:Reverse transcriptase domain-containing protein n=1 Tax=Vitis vinifera TaxID=29760 RepID=A5C724_VITVI|nr:hypothetical protein VITISV_033603 [Vitis vinifera]
MRAYIAHNMDGNGELLTNLEMAGSEVVATQKLAKEGACLLRKVEKEKEAPQVKAHLLVEEKMAMEAEKEKIEEETAWLRWELQDLRAGFAAQKKDLEVDYQKQVDDMLFYGYRCYMMKHDIANDTLNFPFDDEDDEFFGGPTLGEGLEPGEQRAPGDGPSNEDGSHDERGAPKLVRLGDCCICLHGIRLGHAWSLARLNTLEFVYLLLVFWYINYLEVFQGRHSLDVENTFSWIEFHVVCLYKAECFFQRLDELPKSTRILRTSNPPTSNVRIETSSCGCNTRLTSIGGKVIVSSIGCTLPFAKHIIPYVEGHELFKVHDVVKRVARSVIHYELGHYEPSGQLIANDMGVERCGEHVIQPSTNRVSCLSRLVGQRCGGTKEERNLASRLVTKIFKPLMGRIVEVYIDDLVVKSKTRIEHIQHLEEAFSIMWRYNMKLNPLKCVFGVSAGKFLGYLMTQRGIQINLDKLYPFFTTLCKAQTFRMEDCKSAFDAIKHYLIEPLILSSPEEVEELYMYLAISNHAIIVDIIAKLPQKWVQTDTTNHYWILHIDGASRTSGAGVWLVLLSPTRKQIKKSVHLDFLVFNNETEYEAMMVGLKLALALAALKIEI